MAALDTGRMKEVFLPLISGLISLVLLIHYHDCFWYAPDEGVFAYFADLVHQGKIYGVDFHGVQPGYHALWNAFLFDIFGRDLIVLRYPFIVLAALQAAMVSYMLRKQGVFLSLAAGFWVTCFGFLQFINPSANWYAFYLAFFCIFVLLECPRSVWGLLLTGGLIGLCLGLRHPSGVFLGAGVLAYLLFDQEPDRQDKAGKTHLARFLLLLMLSGLLSYSFVINFDLGGLLYIGIWPVLLTLFILYKRPVCNADALKVVVPCGVGVMAGIAPLFLYQALYGDLSVWLQTSVLNSSRILEMDFFDTHKYYDFVFYAVSDFVTHTSLVTLANAVYWMALYCIIPLCGALVVYHGVIKKQYEYITPVTVIPLFFGYVSLYYQIPIYLFFSLGLYGIGLLTLLPLKYKNRIALMAVFLSVFSMWHYIAMPLETQGEHKTVSSQIEGASLKINEQSHDQYKGLLAYIDKHTTSEDYIFAFPVNPEIYFLSQRKNPTPYISTAISIASDQTYNELLEMLTEKPPRLIISRPEDKYTGVYEERLVSDLVSKLGYKQATTIGHFVLYAKE